VDRTKFIQQCSAYATGALADEELKSFAEYLHRASQEERELLAELVTTASLLPLVLDRKTPPTHLKQQLMQRIKLASHAQQAVSERTVESMGTATLRRRNWIPLGVSAVIGMIVLFSLFALRLLNTIDEQNKSLATVQTEKQQLQTRIVALTDELTRKEELLKVLASKRIEMTVMNGLKSNPVSYGKIIWDPEKRTAILQVSNLPPVPSDKDYQLWVIKDKKPISAGVFALRQSETNGFFKIENLAEIDRKSIGAFAVTLEPKGGVPQPTGQMYLLGTPSL
jgi:anti-sigma-K factor RskA